MKTQQPPRPVSTKEIVRQLSGEPWRWTVRQIAQHLDLTTQAVYKHKHNIAAEDERVSA